MRKTLTQIVNLFTMAYEGHRRKNVIYYFEKIRNVEITIVVSRQTAMATVPSESMKSYFRIVSCTV